jgi:hypothetical protein
MAKFGASIEKRESIVAVKDSFFVRPMEVLSLRIVLRHEVVTCGDAAAGPSLFHYELSLWYRTLHAYLMIGWQIRNA